nr:hypothetical protein CFP56_03256 [Quercus suber]
MTRGRTELPLGYRPMIPISSFDAYGSEQVVVAKINEQPWWWLGNSSVVAGYTMICYTDQGAVSDFH